METPVIKHRLVDAQKIQIPNVAFPFIVGEEVGHGRRFLIFRDVEDYLSKIEYYNHCHEYVLKRQWNPSAKLQGRLVFDFDIPSSVKVPSSFRMDFEELVRDTADRYMINIESEKFIFVWMHSPNPKKTSYHLIVKNCLFVDEWVDQMKEFYQLLIAEAGRSEKFEWIESSKLIDTQIAHNNASLRMLHNSKIGGSPLELVDPDSFNFYDSLIVIRRKQDLIEEQGISFANMILPQDTRDDEGNDIEADDEQFDEAMSQLETFDSEISQSFRLRCRNRCFFTLDRVKPSKCLVSGRYHGDVYGTGGKGDNAYIRVDKFGRYWFGCFRDCRIGNKREVPIGQEMERPDSLSDIVIPDF